MSVYSMNRRFVISALTALSVGLGVTLPLQSAFASCGAVNCFMVIGSQAGIPQKGTVTANVIYQNINQGDLIDGTTGIIPAVEIDGREIVIGEHRERSTRTQITTVDLNVGMTDRFAVQLTLPVVDRSHLHDVEIGTVDEESRTFNDTGLGDIRLTGKYNILSSLANMIVLGFGVELPTGKTMSKTDNTQSTQEASLQIGRGNVGLIGSVYQTHQIIPQVLSQFASASYRHTFRNNAGYQFGDEYILGAGLNWQAWTYLVLTGQVNWRYLVHDNFSSSLRIHEGGTVDSAITDRRVPTTGSTTLMFTPGITIQNIPYIPRTSAYVNMQIPMVRDFNNNLAQDTSFIFGITHFFNLFGSEA